MKRILLLLFIITTNNVFAQTFTTNTTPVGMEHNLLFNAVTRYNVTQLGKAKLDLKTLFDGKFAPSYTSESLESGTTSANSGATEITIEGLPSIHIQTGAWVGWSTRYWEAKRFKIEGYDSYYSPNGWKTIADYQNQDYTGGRKFNIKVPQGAYTKLRFTFYTSTGTNDRLGVSELFFIHPEATPPYNGLFSNNSQWQENDSNISYAIGSVGIGTSSPKGKLNITNPKTIGLSNLENSSLLIGTPAFGIGLDSNEIVAKGTDLHIGTISDNKNVKIMSGKANVSLFIKGSNGNIGIGTLNPQGFKLGVNGPIATTEVKVAEYDNWPDFVFKGNYNLPTLTEVENHIKNKGHLKDIPSAKEVAKDGFYLGGMDAKLLQKIEELTLYTIQQQKELKEKDTKLKELEAKFNAQELRLYKIEKLLNK